MKNLKYKRLVLSHKTEIGNVIKVVIDFGWVDAEDVQPSIQRIRQRYPGWKLISCYAIKEEQIGK